MATCVPETATAAVKHHHDLVRDGDSKFFSECSPSPRTSSVPRDLHFQIMITAAECTDLIEPSVDCAFADFRGISAGDTTVLLA